MLNKYTLEYMVAASIAIIMGMTALARLSHLHMQDDPGASSASINAGEAGASASSTASLSSSALQVSRDDVVHVSMSDGREIDVQSKLYARRIFVYFSVVMACVNLSMGLYSVSWQPIMVNSFGATGQTLGVIYEIISVVAVIPPLLVAYLSRHIQDRHILLIGIVAKLVGVACFLPLFGPVREWQVVLGFIIIIKASIFFFTSSMSLFTKLLGDMHSGAMLGVLSSVSALGPALAQIFFADYMLQHFGTLRFGIFGLPVVFALCLVLWPWFWTRLDPTREFTRRLLDGYSALHSHDNIH
jgi:hypothetical protein